MLYMFQGMGDNVNMGTIVKLTYKTNIKIAYVRSSLLTLNNTGETEDIKQILQPFS